MLNQKISVFLAGDNVIVRECIRHAAVHPDRMAAAAVV